MRLQTTETTIVTGSVARVARSLALASIVALSIAGWDARAADAAATPTPVPEASSGDDSKADAKAEPKPDANAEPKADAKAEPKADAKAEPKADAKAEPKADAKAEPKPDAKAEPKPDTKAEPKADAKAEPKPDTKSEPKADAKAEPKADAKAEPKADAKAEPKADAKAEPKAGAKADADPGDKAGDAARPEAGQDKVEGSEGDKAAAPAPDTVKAKDKEKEKEKEAELPLAGRETLPKDSVRRIIGAEVKSGKSAIVVATIANILVDPEGRIAGAVLDYGGFMGVGKRRIAVAWSLLSFDTGKIVLALTRDQLKEFPDYRDGEDVVLATAPAPPN